MLRASFIWLFFVFVFNSYGQLTTSTALSPTALVQNVLLGGGVSVTNVSLTGYTNAAGSFHFNLPGTIGFQDGVILTTGTVEYFDPIYGYDRGPHGPNDQQSGGVDNQYPGSFLFSSLTSGDTYNATILSFDFIPQYDSVKFNYVFGSEEYPEYVCSEFNDVFGFFISGPNPAGGSYVNKNIAIVPNTNFPVAINTINPGSPGGFGSFGSCTSLAYSNYYIDNTSGSVLQYDGYTKKLTAKAAVKCGETYHFEIAIADVGDGIFDSGVFLESNSFVSSNSLQVNSEVTLSTQQSTINEGCGEAIVNFTRNSNAAQNTDTVFVNYSGSALLNSDYTISASPSSYFILPAGQTTVSFTINPIADALTESDETITMQLTSSIGLCNSQSNTLTFTIKDITPISLATSDTIVCLGNLVHLSFSASGGSNNPMQYSWNTLSGNQVSNTADFDFVVIQDTSFIASAIDACFNNPTMDTVYVKVIKENYLSAIAFDVVNKMNDDVAVEKCDSILLKFTRLGNNLLGVDTFYYSLSGTAINQQDYPDLNGTVSFAANQTEISVGFRAYDDNMNEVLEELIVSSLIHPTNQCFFYPTADTLLLKDSDTLLLNTFDTVLCVGETINLLASASGGYGFYLYFWDTGLDTVSSQIITATTPMQYIVYAKDECDNISSNEVFSIDIHNNIPELMNIANDSACEQWNYFFDVNVVNATHPVTYVFESSLQSQVQSFNNGFIINSIQASQQIYVEITDRCGRTDTDTFFVEVKNCDINLPTVITNNGDGVNDVLYFENLEYYPNSKLVVFNRWGTKLYETSNYTNDYSPDYSDGTYYYILELPNGKVFPMYFLLIKN